MVPEAGQERRLAAMVSMREKKNRGTPKKRVGTGREREVVLPDTQVPADGMPLYEAELLPLQTWNNQTIFQCPAAWVPGL